MWCWGCDVRRADGNLLMLYGAEKRPSPEPRFHSAYTFYLEEGYTLNLWGWGIWLAHEAFGSLFVSRARFAPAYTPEVHLTPHAWQKDELPPTAKPKTSTQAEKASSLLAIACQWIGDYEAWVSQQTGDDYRQRTLESWVQRKRYKGGIPAPDMPHQWQQLAQQIMSIH